MASLFQSMMIGTRAAGIGLLGAGLIGEGLESSLAQAYTGRESKGSNLHRGMTAAGLGMIGQSFLGKSLAAKISLGSIGAAIGTNYAIQGNLVPGREMAGAIIGGVGVIGGIGLRGISPINRASLLFGGGYIGTEMALGNSSGTDLAKIGMVGAGYLAGRAGTSMGRTLKRMVVPSDYGKLMQAQARALDGRVVHPVTGKPMPVSHLKDEMKRLKPSRPMLTAGILAAAAGATGGAMYGAPLPPENSDITRVNEPVMPSDMYTAGLALSLHRNRKRRKL